MAVALLCDSPARAEATVYVPSPLEMAVASELRQVPADASPQQRIAALDRALAQLTQPTPMRGQMLCLKAQHLAALSEFAPALDSLKKCRALLPNDANVTRALMAVSWQMKDAPGAAGYLIELIGSTEQAANQVDPEMISSLARQLMYANQPVLRKKLALAIVENGWFRDNPAFFSTMSFIVLGDRVKNGDVDGALALLPDITSPDTGIDLLLDRRFAAIWPQVEAWAGADLAVQRKAMLALAQARYAAAASAANRLAYLRALAATGHRDEAIAGFERWMAEGAPAKADSYEFASAAVRLGALLTANGDREAAIRTERSAVAQAADARLIIEPNLAVDLILAGRPHEALQVLGEDDWSLDDVEAPEAKGYLYALRACAFAKSGKLEQGRAQAAALTGAFATNAEAVDIATSCLANDDSLAQWWIGKLNTPAWRRDAIREIAQACYNKAHGIPEGSIQEWGVRRICGRGDIEAAYLKSARHMPARYGLALNDFNPVPR